MRANDEAVRDTSFTKTKPDDRLTDTTPIETAALRQREHSSGCAGRRGGDVGGGETQKDDDDDDDDDDDAHKHGGDGSLVARHQVALAEPQRLPEVELDVLLAIPSAVGVAVAQ